MKVSRASISFTAVLLFILICIKAGPSQTIIPSFVWRTDTLIIVTDPEYEYNFPPTHYLRSNTLQIRLNRQPLSETLDYKLDDSKVIHFYRKFKSGDSLRIRYQRLPILLRRNFRLFELDSSKKNIGSDSLKTLQQGVRMRAIRLENPLAHIPSTLQTSGSIMRGIQIGSNQDFTLNSGLNLQLSGKLTDDIEIVAALTDEATPIQPEGNTQTLEEVDKVFVQFKSPFIQGTVGDFNLAYKNTQFGNIQRKLQGLTLETSIKRNRLGVTIASTRGFFHHVSFLGQEGNQGPYLLTGKNGEREIIVLAGTERVYINGERMVRGESNDYVIEYGNGQIRFTNHRLITSESRIEVDFEYFPAVQNYNRNVYSAFSQHQFKSNKLQLNVHYYREQDNTGQVLEESAALTAQEKAILKQAGDDPFKALEPGYKYKGDSLASYIQTDTLLNGIKYTIFKYVGKQAGDYSVSYSFLGKGKGDYVRDRLGVYRWVGPGKGEYAPVRLIPLPSKQELIDLHLSGQPWKPLKIEAEYALSNLDRNTFSSVDDGDNKGHAFQLKSSVSDLPLKIKNTNLGQLNMTFNTRYIQKTFRAADRFQNPDFRRYWNLYSAATDNPEELSFQLNTRYQPAESVQLLNNIGKFSQSGFTSNRTEWRLAVDRPRILTSKIYFLQITSDNRKANLKDNWKRYGLFVEKSIWKITPQLNYQGEWRKQRSELSLTGFRFDDAGIGLQLAKFKHLSGVLNFNNRRDYVYDPQQSGDLLLQAISNTYQLRLGLKNVKSTTLNLTLMQRKKDYTKHFEAIQVDTLKLFYIDPAVQDTSWRDRSTSLAQIDLTQRAYKNAFDLSWQYRLSTEETALKEKVYVEVGEGRGNLRFDPWLKEYVPDPLGNYILYILPSGKFEPVSNVQTAFRLRFDPYKYTRKYKNLKNRWFSKISGESYLRIEEESRDPDKLAVYLLNPSHLQKSYTVRGVMNFYQDIYLMRHNRNLSFRLRYRLSNNYNNQYLDSNENDRRKNQEMGLRIDWRPRIKLRSQSEARLRSFIRNSTTAPLRNRRIGGYYLRQNFSYRPQNRWEIGFESEGGYERNSTPLYPLSLWFMMLKQRLNYALPGRGRASAEYQVQNVEVLNNPRNLVVPFEMAQGKKKGISHGWQLRIEYTLSKNILFTFQYSGRRDAGYKKTIHTGQAELRAYL
ncbi:MAG: hypothetical protein GXO77_12945 [Calditrichaeota bacterium]|nr:hypothetical protein [Calditrichota bacterium]